MNMCTTCTYMCSAVERKCSTIEHCQNILQKQTQQKKLSHVQFYCITVALPAFRLEIQQGFRIGFNRAVKCRSALSNMFSAVENPGVVMEYLKKERSLGRLMGPIPSEVVSPEAHVSPFGVILK